VLERGLEPSVRLGHGTSVVAASVRARDEASNVPLTSTSGWVRTGGTSRDDAVEGEKDDNSEFKTLTWVDVASD
jgi:hypothetical protein